MMRRSCVARRMTALNFLKEPWERQTLDEAKAQQAARGEDIAANLTSDFVKLQLQLVSYRIKRIGTEMAAFRAEPGKFLFSQFGLVSILYAVITYFAFMCMGRFSFTELTMPPTTA